MLLQQLKPLLNSFPNLSILRLWTHASLLGLNLRKKADCQTARETLDDHIGHVRERLAELAQLEIDLVALRKRCNGQDASCHLIEALHDRARQAPASTGRAGPSQFGKAHKASAHKHL